MDLQNGLTIKYTEIVKFLESENYQHIVIPENLQRLKNYIDTHPQTLNTIGNKHYNALQIQEINGVKCIKYIDIQGEKIVKTGIMKFSSFDNFADTGIKQFLKNNQLKEKSTELLNNIRLLQLNKSGGGVNNGNGSNNNNKLPQIKITKQLRQGQLH